MSDTENPNLLRDLLALDRTVMANERTLLAYQRTAFMLAVSGLTLMKLFPESRAMVVLGVLFMPLGVTVAVLGAVRYAQLRRKINQADPTRKYDLRK